MTSVGARRGLCLAFALVGCGSPHPPANVIARTPEASIDDVGTAEGLEKLVARDEKKAADILRNAVVGNGPAAPLAAAYLARLGLAGTADPAAMRAAFAEGTHSPDPLTAALSWRWLASGAFGPPPPIAGDAPALDPAIAALAALSHIRFQTPLPPALRSALDGPSGTVETAGGLADMAAIEALFAAASPFDDGALGRAVAFVRTRAERSIDLANARQPSFVALRLADEMANIAFGAGFSTTQTLHPPGDPNRESAPSVLESRLANPLLRSELSVLRGTVVRGRGQIRIDALRALAAKVTSPAAGDLGASASALSSDDPMERVEAARTYLLLAARATR